MTSSPQSPPRHRLATTCRRPSAFTLVELLVVIAIVGILAALVALAANGVRDSAGRARCASNLRQIALATLSYGNEHRGQAPYPDRDSAGNPSYDLLPHQFLASCYNETLRPYLGDPCDVMYCPGKITEEASGLYDPARRRALPPPTTYNFSYQYFNRSENVPADHKTLFLNLRDAPPQYAMWGCLAYKVGGTLLGHSEPRVPGTRFRGMNAAYADGSVRWVDGDRLTLFRNTGFYWPRPVGQ